MPELLYAEGAVGELWRRLHDQLEHPVPAFAQSTVPLIAMDSAPDQTSLTLHLPEAVTRTPKVGTRPRKKSAAQSSDAQIETSPPPVGTRSKSPVAAVKKAGRAKATRSAPAHAPASQDKGGSAE